MVWIITFVVSIAAGLIGHRTGINRERNRSRRMDATWRTMPARIYCHGKAYRDGTLESLVVISKELPHRLPGPPEPFPIVEIRGLAVEGLGQIPYRPPDREKARINGDNPS